MLKLSSLNKLQNPVEQFLNEKEAFKYILDILKTESPRISKRCVQELDFFYSSFRNKNGMADTKSIKICDLVALSYIKIKYPFVIDFFLKTIHLLLERTGIDWYLLRDRFKDKENYLSEWITDVLGRSLNDLEKIRVKELIGLVAHQYLIMNRNPNIETKEQYHQRTSDWITLYNALTLISDNIENQFEKYYDLYTQHKKDKKIIGKLETKQLLEYSHFFIDIQSSEQSQHLEVAEEILDRFEQKKIKVDPSTIEDTIYQEAVYQFVFQLLYAIEKNNNNHQMASAELQKLFDLIKKFLQSTKINTKAKYILLNSFANNERGEGSDIHFRLNRAFDNLLKFFKKDIIDFIKSVFEEANKKYFDGSEVIYKSEENFFYVLYQSWSGKADSKEEIEKIRNAAKRGLEDYPKAIKLYWNRYPYNPKWQNFADLLREHTFFSSDGNNELYMPLETLLEITKKVDLKEELSDKISFWEKILKTENENYRKIYTLKDDFTTLKAILIKRNLL